MIDHTYIFRSDVGCDTSEFVDFVSQHDCIIANADSIFFIIEGKPEEIDIFRADWMNWEHNKNRELD